MNWCVIEKVIAAILGGTAVLAFGCALIGLPLLAFYCWRHDDHGMGVVFFFTWALLLLVAVGIFAGYMCGGAP